MDKAKFIKQSAIVVDKLEGGYYHPEMIKDKRVKDNPVFHAKIIGGKQVQHESGETMYGLDRANGGALNTSEAGKKFWALIDSVGAKTKWKYNYKGGTLSTQLSSLLGEIMYPQFDHLSKLYLSTKAQAIVNANDSLFFHFAYATWNGSGFFQKFASPINDAVAKGITSPEALIKIAAASRSKSNIPLIVQSSDDIIAIMNAIKNNPGTTTLGVLGFFLLLGLEFGYILNFVNN